MYAIPGHPTDSQVPALFESDRILIVNKPPGISHHDDEQGTPGIISVLKSQRPEARLWGVHRLDRVTSGILVLAKDAEMAQLLSESFAKQRVQKVYIGISAKRPTKKKQGWVQGNMVRSRNKSWKLERANQSNFAKTRFFTTPFQWENSKFTGILFRPYTGKTHQLRVAAKAMGIPLWGDPVYRDGGMAGEPPRTFLHASGIVLPSLKDQPSVSIWCPPPFEDIMPLGTVMDLMQKRCDVPEILEAMERECNKDMP